MQQKSLMAKPAKDRPPRSKILANPKDVAARLMIWDGNWYINRAHHGYGQYRRLTNKRGEDVTILYGFLQMIGADLLKYRPTHAVVVFDGHDSAKYRRDMFPEYKSSRHTEDTAGSTVDDHDIAVLENIAKVNVVLNFMGIAVMMHEHVEGDDLLGALVHKFSDDSKIIMCTGDKDAATLVKKGVKIYNSQMKVLFNEFGILERYGVMPSQMVDYLCLLGDSIDDIPGCPQVGTKTAQRILLEYGSVKNAIKSGKEKKLEAWYKDTERGYKMSRRLIELRTDLQINASLDDMQIRAPEPDAVELMLDMGIRKPHDWFIEHLSANRIKPLFVPKKTKWPSSKAKD